MKSPFPKPDEYHSKKWACKANDMFIDYASEKSFSHMLCLHIYEELFFKTYPKLALALQTGFLDWRLSPFEKELFK